MIEFNLIENALEKGAVTFPNLSGGKDGQAMARAVHQAGIPMKAVLHCDLGRTEWPQSKEMCQRSADEFGIPLGLIYRNDKMDMLDRWEHRMNQLQGTGKPFWSSSKNRYCTSDMKRDPTDVFYRNCGESFVISMEGIRAEESTARAKKVPLTMRTRCSSNYYEGMSVEQAIAAYHPEHRLVLTWYPIFDWNLEQVWNSYGMTPALLHEARAYYKEIGEVPSWWSFHPAYAMGNDRVSCMLCVLGSPGDIANGAKHNPKLYNRMVEMEEIGNATFKNKWSLKEIGE